MDDNAFGNLSDEMLVKEPGLHELDIAAIVICCRLHKMAWTWYAASLGFRNDSVPETLEVDLPVGAEFRQPLFWLRPRSHAVLVSVSEERT